jgi:hypothetical protein
MGMKKDLGVIATLTAAQIAVAYANAGLVNGGRPDKFRFTFKTTTIGGSAITSIDVQVKASKDGVVYEIVNFIKDAGTLGVTANFPIAAAGTPQENTITCDGSFAFIQVQVKANAAGQALETVIVSAQAF